MRQRTRTIRGAPLPRAAILNPLREAPRVAFTATALLAAALCAALPARSATLTWDASGTATTTATATDGNGTWNAATLRWNNGVSDLGWTNAADIAVIGNNNGAAGTITLTAPLTMGGLIFNPAGSGNYLVTGSTLTLGGVRTVTANTNATIASTFNVGGTFTKDGAGTLALTGGGTSGAASILNGRLVIGNTSRAPSYAISSGAALEVNTPGNVNGGNVSFTGAGSLIKTGAGQLNWGVSAATFALGTGSLIDVQQGTFIGGSSANENWTNNLSDLRVASGASFRGVEANVRVNALLGTGRIDSGLNGAGYQFFTFGVNNGSGTFDGVLADTDAANRGNYIKTGTGTQTLTGVNTFTGYLVVQGGVLSVSAANQLGGNVSNGLYVRTGGSLRYTGAGSASPTARSINWDSGPASIDVVSPAGNLTLTIAGGTRNQAFTKLGPGTLTLQKTTAINEFIAGSVTIAGGTLEYAQNNAGAITRFGGAVTGAAGTQIRVSGTGRIGNDALTANWSANLASLDIGSGASFDLRGQGITVAALTGSGTMANSYENGVDNLVVGASDASGIFSGVIRQTAPTGVVTTGTPVVSLTKTGTGTQILTGTNTYAGGTTISAGTLQLGNGGTTGSIVGNIVDNATLAIDRSDTYGIAGTISGSGLVRQQGTGTTILTGVNTYTGGTLISAGTLQLGNGGTTGSIVGDVIDNGTLAVNRSSAVTLAGNLSGTGAFQQLGTAATTLTGTNTYTGGTTIAAGMLQLGNGGTTGSIVGDVTNNATLVVNRSDDSTLAGNIGGSGNVQKLGAGTLTLSGTNSYGGGTALLKGRIDVGSSSALGTGALAMSEGTTLGFTANGLDLANPVFLTGTTDPIVDTGAFTETLSGAITGGGILTKNGSGTLIVSGANNYTGATNVAQGTLRGGAANTFSSASVHSVAASATLDTGGFNQRVASLSNSGTVSLLGTAPGSTLTVNGAYVGNGGLLRLGTALGDSGSASDRLVLDGAGASATGNTTVQVTHLGGLGALTTGNGINLVSALNGATTTAQTTKNAFALAGAHVDAGAFEYRLFPGDAAGAGENWYLRSTSTVPVVPNTPNTPTTPTTPATPATPGTPTVPTVTLPTYRAEVPMYAALPDVLRQSDLAMLSNLHRRVGDEGQPIDTTAGWGGANRRVWARGLGGTTTVAQGGTTAPESRISMAGLQAGVDMFGNDNWNAGVYAGTLRSDARVSGAYGLSLFTAAYAGSLRADNMYLGGYATYANPQGQYADLVLQYGRHDITGTAAGRSAIDNDATSITASAELGQRFALGSNWGIEPQVQLIYNRQRMERAHISGAHVDQDPGHALIGRLGVRVTGDFMTGAGRLQPYARLNLWHGFRGTDRTSFIGPAGTATVENGIGYTSTEAAAGFTLALTQSTSVYGEAGKLLRTGGGQAQVKSSLQGALGVRVRFWSRDLL